jgi:hypothetical protein
VSATGSRSEALRKLFRSIAARLCCILTGMKDKATTRSESVQHKMYMTDLAHSSTRFYTLLRVNWLRVLYIDLTSSSHGRKLLHRRSMHRKSAGHKTQRSRACPSHDLPRSGTHFSDGTAFVCSCSLQLGQCEKLWRYGTLATSSLGVTWMTGVPYSRVPAVGRRLRPPTEAGWSAWPERPHVAGVMFWFMRKRFCGSSWAFTAARRA